AVTIDLGPNGFTVTHSSAVSDSVYSLNSNDSIVVSGGSLTMAASSTFNSTLQLQGGTLGGAGDITVLGQFNVFPAARLSGSGTLYLDSSSDVEVNDLYLDRPVVSNGQAMMFGHIHLGAGASLSNAAGASLTLEIGTLDGVGSLVNQGTLVKATSPYGPGTVSINVPFSNTATGTVHVQAGTLAFGGGLQAYGTPGTTTFRADPGSELDFGGPPCTFDSSTSVTAATVLFDGTTAAVAGSYHAASTTLYNSQVTFSGGVDLAGCNLGLFSTSTSTFDLSAATLLTPLNLQDLSLGNATLILPADLHVADKFVVFPQATLSGSGTVYLDGSSDVEVNDLYLDRPVVNNGQAMMFGHIHLGAGASLSNAAGASLTLEIGTLDGVGSLVNQGTLVKATSPYGPGTVSINVPFSNTATGTVHVQAGTLAFGGGLQAYGTPGTTTFRADPGSELDFGGPPCTFDSSTSVTAATVLFDGTTAAVAGSYHAASTTLHNRPGTFSGGLDLPGCHLGFFSSPTLDP